MVTIGGLGFVLGLSAVWLYAVLQPQYGVGQRTAVIAGAVVWTLGCLVPNLSLLTFGIHTGRHFWMASVIDLLVVLAASLVGSRIYRGGAAEPRAAGLSIGARGSAGERAAAVELHPGFENVLVQRRTGDVER